MTTTELPRTIQAQVHRDAISRVPDFFNASLRDVLNELFQNSRRSGATRVCVDLQREGGRVTVADDGRGIDDPQALLDFGRSSWDGQTARSEHPAGMGLYALARLDGVQIRSITEGGPAWAVRLSTANFSGEEPAHVDRIHSRTGHGTTVSFTFPKAKVSDVEACARHYPLPVTLNGESIEQWNFLAEAIYIEQWQGLRIGVDRNRQYGLNFHGIVIQDREHPRVNTKQGAWTASVDVTDCTQLRMTLPARKELVQTEFTASLRRACRTAIYRAIKEHQEPVDLPKEAHEEAASLGVRLPEARPLLKRWEPDRADEGHSPGSNIREPVSSHALLMQVGHLPPPDQVALARAAGESGDHGRMMQPDPDMAGYGWYDGLSRMTGLSITMTDEEGNLQRLRARKKAAKTTRPDSIRMTLHGRNPLGKFSLSIDSDLAFENGTEEFAEDNIPLVTRDSAISADELAVIMGHAYFVPSDDMEADSYDTQQERHEETSLIVATSLLHSPEQAAVNAITRALKRHVMQEVPLGTKAVLTILRGPARGRPPHVEVVLTAYNDTGEEGETAR